MSLNRKLVSWSVAAAVALTSIPFGAAPAAAVEVRTITCSSVKGRYNTCDVPGADRVDLVRQLSDAPCRYRQTWGVRNDRIWVDQGCRAVFEVVFAGRPVRPDPGRPVYPEPGPDLSGGEALNLLALLAIVGAAAAILDKNDRVPGDARAVEAAKTCKAYAVYDMRRRGADRIRRNSITDVDRLDRRVFRVNGEIIARFGGGDRRVRYVCRTVGDRVAEFRVR